MMMLVRRYLLERAPPGESCGKGLQEEIERVVMSLVQGPLWIEATPVLALVWPQ